VNPHLHDLSGSCGKRPHVTGVGPDARCAVHFLPLLPRNYILFIISAGTPGAGILVHRSGRRTRDLPVHVFYSLVAGPVWRVTDSISISGP
jgi:hypothetical protein